MVESAYTWCVWSRMVDTASFYGKIFIYKLCSTELLTLMESLISPVGLSDDETSLCLCIEIRKASTPISPILFPANNK